MDQVKRLIPESSPRYLENAAWAEDCLVTAVMCILLCAPLGAIATKLLGPFLLSKVTRLRPSLHPYIPLQ